MQESMFNNKYKSRTYQKGDVQQRNKQHGLHSKISSNHMFYIREHNSNSIFIIVEIVLKIF